MWKWSPFNEKYENRVSYRIYLIYLSHLSSALHCLNLNRITTQYLRFRKLLKISIDLHSISKQSKCTIYFFFKIWGVLKSGFTNFLLRWWINKTENCKLIFLLNLTVDKFKTIKYTKILSCCLAHLYQLEMKYAER